MPSSSANGGITARAARRNVESAVAQAAHDRVAIRAAARRSETPRRLPRQEPVVTSNSLSAELYRGFEEEARSEGFVINTRDEEDQLVERPIVRQPIMSESFGNSLAEDLDGTTSSVGFEDDDAVDEDFAIPEPPSTLSSLGFANTGSGTIINARTFQVTDDRGETVLAFGSSQGFNENMNTDERHNVGLDTAINVVLNHMIEGLRNTDNSQAVYMASTIGQFLNTEAVRDWGRRHNYR